MSYFTLPSFLFAFLMINLLGSGRESFFFLLSITRTLVVSVRTVLGNAVLFYCGTPWAFHRSFAILREEQLHTCCFYSIILPLFLSF